jgi:hypothetical protein
VLDIVPAKANFVLLADEQGRQFESAVGVGHNLWYKAKTRDLPIRVEKDVAAPLKFLICRDLAVFVKQHPRGRSRRLDPDGDLDGIVTDLDDRPEPAIGARGADEQRVGLARLQGIKPNWTLIACSSPRRSFGDNLPTRLTNRDLLTVVNWSAIAFCFFPRSTTGASLG